MFCCSAMTSMDLLDLNLVNLDYKTENYTMEFYLSYFLRYPDDCNKVVGPSGECVGYLLGSHAGYPQSGEPYTHVTALSISPGARGMSLGKSLMRLLEINGVIFGSLFIDLFVRVGNEPAIRFYRGLGYGVHKVVEGYYTCPREDAYDMRKYLEA